MGGLAADFLRLRDGGGRHHPERLGVLCLIDLIQDADLVLPVARALRDDGGFEPRIVMTDWLDRVAPGVAARIESAGFLPQRHTRDALMALAPDLGPWDALLTASESTSASHRFAHALTKRAKSAGLTTFTMQHGLENVGLTYSGDGDHDFASDWIFTWGDPRKLPDWVSDEVRARCIGVGRPEASRRAHAIGALQDETRGIVAVFENLHWQRYNEDYRRRFIKDLVAAAHAQPDIAFVLRPHPAGQFAAKHPETLQGAPSNVLVAASKEPDWSHVSAVDLISRASAVITTPSTIALDAAIGEKPVAVAAYGLNAEAYSPLPLLNEAADWQCFIRQRDAVDLAAFRARHVIEGDAAVAIAQAMHARIASRNGLFQLSLRTRAIAKIKRILRTLPPPVLTLLRGGNHGDAISRREYRRWIRAYDLLTERDRTRIIEIVRSWPDENAAAIIVDARKAGQVSIDRTLASIKCQLLPSETIIWNAGLPLGDILARCQVKFVGVVVAGDTLAEHAAFALVSALKSAPGALFAYSDEDAIDGRGRCDPHFKPDWDPLLFAAQDYACRFAMIDVGAARRAAALLSGEAELHHLIATLTTAEPERPVLHSPFVLYHRSSALSVPEIGAMSAPSIGDAMPMVSLIVPTRDRLALLRNCVDGLLNKTDYPALEVIIVDNDSAEPETLSYLAEVACDQRVRVVSAPGEFNFSSLNNFGAAQARGDILGLINNDIVVIEPRWLREMVTHVLHEDVGAVGAMLLYPNGTIQHVGCVLGIGQVAAHVYSRMPADIAGHGGRLRAAHEVSAVTAACLVTRLETWRRVGGLDEELPVAYNDIDYCLRLRKAGLRVVWTPFARLDHHESASRGEDASGARRARLERDKAFMRARWGRTLLADPFYNPNLTLADTNYGLAFPPRAQRSWLDD